MKNQRGMILLEILLSVVILSVGLIVIYHSILGSLSAFNYVKLREEANRFIGVQVWSISQAIHENPKASVNARNELIKLGNKEARYQLKINPLTPDNKLLEMDHTVVWKVGGHMRTVERIVYLLTPGKA